MTPATLLKTRVTLIWFVLIVATLLSVLLFERYASTAFDRYAAMGVIVIAFAKVRWVGLDFMELRGAPLGLRAAFEGWVVTMTTILLVLYWRSGSISP